MEVNEKVITDILARLGKLEEVVFSTTHPRAAPTREKKVSPKEFLIAKSAKSDPERVLVLGYFLEHYEGMESFNIRDLEVVFQAAKVSSPMNINETVNKSIARGFLMEVAEKKDSKKAWSVTATGEQYVENDLKIAKN